MLAMAETETTEKKTVKKGTRKVRVLEYRKEKVGWSAREKMYIARLLLIDEEEDLMYEYPGTADGHGRLETAAQTKADLDTYIKRKLVPGLLPSKNKWHPLTEAIEFLMERDGFEYYREFESEITYY